MNPAPRHRPSQYNWFNQLLSVSGPSGATSFGYDGNGNQVSKTDGLGTTSYAYNYDNRLVGISGPVGASSFEYDANGLRTKKSDSTGTRSYLLDGLSVVAEFAPDASRLACYTQSLARIDEVLSVVNSTGKYWYETDALGTTYAMTNAAGTVVSRSAYDVFGERSLAAGADVAQPFGFTGREHDPGSGLVYARARYLQPWAGTWDRADPLHDQVALRLGVVAALNPYAYAHQSPTRFTDPSGMVVPLLAWLLVVIGISFGLRNDDQGFDNGLAAAAVGVGLGVGAVGVCLSQTLTLYRAVSIAEAEDLAFIGAFRAGPGALGAKFFAEHLPDAVRWGQYFFGRIGQDYRIVAAEVSPRVLEVAEYWKKLDGIGPAYAIDVSELVGVVFRVLPPPYR